MTDLIKNINQATKEVDRLEMQLKKLEKLTRATEQYQHSLRKVGPLEAEIVEIMKVKDDLLDLSVALAGKEGGYVRALVEEQRNLEEQRKIFKKRLQHSELV